MLCYQNWPPVTQTCQAKDPGGLGACQAGQIWWEGCKVWRNEERAGTGRAANYNVPTSLLAAS